jgi:8-oxo-dGTP pyrophosphatase MutT (NUDIX family)
LREEQPWYHVIREWLPWWMLLRWENPDEAVVREVQEETWISFSKISLLTTLFSNIGLAEAYRHYYICRDPVSFGEQHLDAWWEKIEIVYYSFDEFIAKILDNSEFVSDLWDWIIRNYVLKNKLAELKSILFATR